MHLGRVCPSTRKRLARCIHQCLIAGACAALWAAPGFPQATGQTQTQTQTPTPTQPAAQAYIVEGSLRLYSTNDPAPEMIRVELKKYSGETAAATFTREFGEFRFVNVAGGIYLLVVEEEGFEAIHERIELRGPDTRRRFQFYLRELVTARDASTRDASVPARELALSQKAASALRRGREELFVKNNPSGGLEHFNKLAKEAPDFYEAYFYRGLALSGLGRMEEAEMSLRQAIEQSGEKHVASLVKLASMLSNQKRFAEAEPLARKSTELDATAWLAQFELARALHGLNRPEDALRAAEAAKALRPDFPKLYLVLINIHIRRGDSRGVLAAMDEYLRLVPQGAMSDTVRAERKKLLEGMSRPAQNKPPTE
jgi:tetratricopeptide (TPR) repeat protein